MSWKLTTVSGIPKFSANSTSCNPLIFAKSAHICGIRNNYPYSVVAESATKLMSRQNLRYRYLYAESTEILFVEST